MASATLSLLLLQVTAAGVLAGRVDARRAPAPGMLQNFQTKLVHTNSSAPLVLRAMYMPAPLTCDNPVANEKSTIRDSTTSMHLCSRPDTAIAECFAFENWFEGWVGGTMVDAFKRSGARVEVMTPANFSEASRAAYSGSSSFTRCAWEVHLGNVDVCVGDFWETSERREIVPFTSSIDSDHIKILIKKESTSNFWEEGLWVWGRPLSPGVWAATFGMFALGGFCLWLIDSEGNDMYLPGERVGNLAHPQLSGFFKSFWVAMMGISARTVHHATRWEGRIVLTGLTLCTWVTGVTYTASLASVLIKGTTLRGKYDSLSAIAAERGTICTLQALENHIRNSFSPQTMASLTLKGFGDFGPMLVGLQRGDCQAAMIGKNEFRDYVEAENQQFSYCSEAGDPKNGDSVCALENSASTSVDLFHCEMPGCARGGNTKSKECEDRCPDYHRFCDLMELKNLNGFYQPNVVFALPVAPHLQNILSAWITKARSAGEITQHADKWAVQESELVCPAGDGRDKSAADGVQLDSLLGLYICCIFLMATGVVMRVFMEVAPEWLLRLLVAKKWREPLVASIVPCTTHTRHPPGYVQKHTHASQGSLPEAGARRQGKDPGVSFERVALEEEGNSDLDASNGNAMMVNRTSEHQFPDLQGHKFDFLRHNTHEQEQDLHQYQYQRPTNAADAMPLTQDFRDVSERDLVTDLRRQWRGADVQQQQQLQLLPLDSSHHHERASRQYQHQYQTLHAADAMPFTHDFRDGNNAAVYYGGGEMLQQPQSARPRYGQVDGLTPVESREMSQCSDADKTRGIAMPIHDQKGMEKDHGGIYQGSQHIHVFRTAPNLMPLPPLQNPLAEPNGRPAR